MAGSHFGNVASQPSHIGCGKNPVNAPNGRGADGQVEARKQHGPPTCLLSDVMTRTKSEGNIGAITCLFDKVPEDLPCLNAKALTAPVIPADVHQPDESARLALSDRKCSSQLCVIEFIAVFLVIDFPPVLPVL
jgi:hypothetical protein